MTDSARLTAALADRYRIERELGAGGMATVYLAQDLKHDRQVAIKVLRSEISATLGAERFAREIGVVAKLQHPHILPLLDSGTKEGLFYFVMPYIEGDSLRDRLMKSGELPVHDAVRLLVEVADALSHAHSRGVVHRDIKPENIMLSGRHAMVMDFGVAKAVTESTGPSKLTSVGIALGTPTYMAPEQATADPHLDHRVDIYALGVLAYELLTGRPPLTGATPQAVLAAHITQVPEPVEKHRPGLSPGLSAVVMKCLAKHAADRWQSAEELVQQLEPLATPSGGMTPTGTAPLVVRTRRPWMMAVGVGAAIVAVGLALTWRGHARQGPPLALDRVQLTTSGRAYQPSVAPDGKEVAYTEQHCASDSTPCDQRLVVQDVATGAQQTISDSMDHIRADGWSSSGAWLLVWRFRSTAREEPHSYVVSHLGGPGTAVGDPAAFAPGDTLLDVATGLTNGAHTMMLRTSVAPFTQPVDSVAIAVPPGGTLLDFLQVSPNGRWIAALWSPVGQLSFILTILDRQGRQVSSRTIDWRTAFRWTPSSSGLLRPLLSGNQGGEEFIAVTSRGAFGASDTLHLSASGKTGWLSQSRDGAIAAYDESRDGEAALYTLEASSDRAVPRLIRRVAAPAVLAGASITQDGATIVYATPVAAGGPSLRLQFYALPYGGGRPTAVTPPIADVQSADQTADARSIALVTAASPGRWRLTVYDIASGAVTASVERADSVAPLVAPLSSGGMAWISANQVTFLDSTLREVSRVQVPDSMGRIGSVASGAAGSVALLIQPLDMTPLYQTDLMFHVPVLIATPSGGLRRFATAASRTLRDFTGAGDGSIRLVGNSGRDPNWVLSRIPTDGGPQQVIGRLPFHDWTGMALSANGRRGVVIIQPRLSDIWVVRNIPRTMQ